MESAYTKNIYFTPFDNEYTIRRKLYTIPGFSDAQVENKIKEIKRDITINGRSVISYIQHGYGVVSDRDNDITKINLSNFGTDTIIKSNSMIQIKEQLEETNKKLLLL